MTGIARLDCASYCAALLSSYFIDMLILYGFFTRSARAFNSIEMSLVPPAEIPSR